MCLLTMASVSITSFSPFVHSQGRGRLATGVLLRLSHRELPDNEPAPTVKRSGYSNLRVVSRGAFTVFYPSLSSCVARVRATRNAS